MNKKHKVSVANTTKCIVSFYVMSIIALATIVLITALGNPCLLYKAYAQDLNPPTTGKTSPHVTSTFGPNLPIPANRSNAMDNGTRGSMNNSDTHNASAPR